MRLIDLETLSKKTSLSVSTLRNYIKNGMPCYCPKRKYLIDWEEFKILFQQYRDHDHHNPSNIKQIVDEVLKDI